MANNPLDELRPIILPNYDVSAWPLAAGWWILLGILLVLAACIYILRPIFKAYKAKKQRQENTLYLLNQLYTECSQQKDRPKALQHYLQNSNDIFKRLVHADKKLALFAQLTGKEWINFILKVDPEGSFAKLYGDTLYASQCNETINNESINLADLHHWAEQWIGLLAKSAKKIARESAQ